ncbi:hypothetical protein [Acinetobacter ursingii]|uniref:hypothetical protein n=1 Tax=Acinetobacter ursingii TaxID=108980 RepID=UPI003AF45C66
MNYYHIYVNDKIEAVEAKELFEAMGYKFDVDPFSRDITGDCWLNAMKDGSFGFAEVALTADSEELSLSELRDLVVLHRNDVKDATHTHKNFGRARSIILSATNEVCDWVDGKWKVTCRQISELKPLLVEKGLISGADALRAIADGKELEFLHDSQGWVSGLGLNIEQVIGGLFQLRLKPQTILINGIEVPAPFEPKENNIFWTLSTNYECGYVQILCYRNDEQGNRLTQFGAWRTEEEIKQVVAALRKVFEVQS